MKCEHIQIDNITLRRVQPEYAADITAVMRRIYPDLYGYLWEDNGASFLDTVFAVEALAKELEDINQPSWVVTYDGKDVGIVKLTLGVGPGDEPDSKCVKLHRIYLDAAYHRLGIGTQLLDCIEQLSREQKQHIIWLEAMACEPKALKFYEKHGFAFLADVLLPYPNAHERYRPMHVMSKLMK